MPDVGANTPDFNKTEFIIEVFSSSGLVKSPSLVHELKQNTRTIQ
jgi:hypothetical protein